MQKQTEVTRGGEKVLMVEYHKDDTPAAEVYAVWPIVNIVDYWDYHMRMFALSR